MANILLGIANKIKKQNTNTQCESATKEKKCSVQNKTGRRRGGVREDLGGGR